MFQFVFILVMNISPRRKGEMANEYRLCRNGVLLTHTLRAAAIRHTIPGNTLEKLRKVGYD